MQQIESDIADLENQIEGDIESSEILTLGEATVGRSRKTW